ncbi:type VI secretion system ATPase TssH [Phyllobacterium phragmitis]|uniref:Type VI secretion system ATPase TssH n=1 Tax=Phyllobacterium phragmitis TaxID=2670329 RepID=A0A2S9IKU9_9HYPH|nr:type VI secretion system ATPase TssH [Phyllobacterium phragmitis]PRD41156.1 type VI secretion system ATPase TssH [Phyllobacterium phragmitis]
MPDINLNRLVRTLEPALQVSLEAAVSLAVRNAHSTVEIAHWMRTLVDIETISPIFAHAGVNLGNLRGELDLAVDDLVRGDGSIPTLSQNMLLLAREAWLIASLQFGRDRIKSGDLLIALSSEQSLRLAARGIAPSLRDINVKAIEAELQADTDTGAIETEPHSARASPGDDEFLRLYTQDMTADARAGRIDPVIGRDRELRQVIDVLMRRRQNNPILVGEAGVGKTAIAEALALAIAAGDVPQMLKDVRLLSLDLSLLQAGAGVKGEFERRLHGVAGAVKKAAEPIILFIDEAHKLIGAGGQQGQDDAANILKPSLARGELRTVAATTWSEYKRFIEKDAALTRRFQTVKVEEPDEETAIQMLRGVASAFTAHHGVRIRDEALAAAVRLSARYIPARQLPDKAISLIDTAAASVALARQAPPEAFKMLRNEDDLLGTEAEWLANEPATMKNRARLLEIEARRAQVAAEIEVIETRYGEEMRLVREADRLEALLSSDQDDASNKEGSAGASEDGDDVDIVAIFSTQPADRNENARTALLAAERSLSEFAGEKPLVPRVVDRDVVASLVARWTGIPVGKLLSDQVETVKTLDARLKERIIGQDAAIARIAASMQTARAGLSDPSRPPAVFLLVGTSGTGKTETALSLTDLLYGGGQYLTTINMSEFKEEHKISMLLGSPPGYVGFGEGGVLTEAVRRRPYGVLLLDEIDKAHPGVQEIFYQVFDKGTLRDGEGRDIDFKNTTILMTANSGAELLSGLAADPDAMPEGETLERLLMRELQKHFKPAFLGRTTILPFMPLDKGALSGIVDIQLGRIADRVRISYGTELALSPQARHALVSRAEASEIGARAIESMIARDLLPILSKLFLDALATGQTYSNVEIGFDANHFSAIPAQLADKEEFVEPESRTSDNAATDDANGLTGCSGDQKGKERMRRNLPNTKRKIVHADLSSD